MDRDKLDKDWEELGKTEGKDDEGEDVKGNGESEAELLLLKDLL